jgi:hypothetical protein
MIYQDTTNFLREIKDHRRKRVGYFKPPQAPLSLKNLLEKGKLMDKIKDFCL